MNHAEAASEPTTRTLLALLSRHRDSIAHTLRSGDVFTPLLVADERAEYPANDWAKGFLRGMELRRRAWASLVSDEEHGGSLVPIFALAHDHDPDPEMRPYKEPIPAELRETDHRRGDSRHEHLSVFQGGKHGVGALNL